MYNQQELMKTKRKPTMSVLVKCTNDCNLKCEYCFDKPLRDKLGDRKMNMTEFEEVLDLLNKSSESVQFIFHGGESTLMGKQWFRDVMPKFHERYATEWNLSMQSNGVLLALDHSWIDVFEETGIEVGTSYDGYTQSLRFGGENVDFEGMIKEYRKNPATQIGTITVINSTNVDKMQEIYDKYRKTFGDSYSFAFNTIYRTTTNVTDGIEIGIDEYIKHYKPYAKYVLTGPENSSHERSILETLNLLLGNNERTCCTYSDCRLNWLGVNSDGSLLPCDRPLTHYSLPHISNFERVEDVYESEEFQRYYWDIQERLDNECSKCGIYDLCQGGCNANHINDNPAELANVCSQGQCDQIIQRLIAMYEVIQDIPVDVPVSPILTQLTSSPARFVPQELEMYFGGKVNMRIEGITDVNEFTSTKQYRLFRLFNPLTEDNNTGHTDMIVQTTHSHSGSNILQDFDKRNLFEETYKLHEDKIKEILNEK